MITKHTKPARLPQAPRTALPELAEFLAPLEVHFTQGPSAQTLRQYLTGLLSEHPNKNCDTLAEVVPETNEQQFNHLLTDMVWDESALNRQRIARMQTTRCPMSRVETRAGKNFAKAQAASDETHSSTGWRWIFDGAGQSAAR